MEKTLLVTGFQPFGKEETNPSGQVLEMLGSYSGGLKIETLLLPVSFKAAGPLLVNTLDRLKDSLSGVIAMGQAGNRAGVTLERVAVNLEDAPTFPDNDGDAPDGRQVIPGAPDGYFSTLPIKALVEALRNQGVPAGISESAGTYVCNSVMFRLLHWIRSGNSGVFGGFVHLPYSTLQAANKGLVPSLTLETMSQAVRIMAAALETKCM